MRRAPAGRWAIWGAILSTLASLSAAAAPPSTRSNQAARVADYTIHAQYDDATHTVAGSETILWRNRGKTSTNELQLHLYLNAFANSKSSFVRAAGGEWKKFLARHPDPWGYCEIRKITVDGVDLTANLQFIHPDDDNVDDHTVARVSLPSPVLAGDELRIEIEFVSRLPRVAARSGHAGPFAMVAQWYPKLGVLENGRWNCHQYHLTTEFYADFGIYDVHLTVPATGVVGASGLLAGERVNGDDTKTLHFVAEDVHDFAWVIDPRFAVVERIVEGVPIRLLLQPNHLHQAERHIDALAAGLRRLQSWIGPFPYPQLTVVDPGAGGLAAGGMEYPMLITVGTTWWMPSGLRLPDITAIHELGHQYWYAAVASNEAREAWLDEGVNTFLTARVVAAEFDGVALDLFGLQASALALPRFGYLRSPQRDPIDRHAAQFLDRRSYVSISYDKTALMLETLDRLLGGDVVTRGLAAYFERWKFRHPTATDLLAALEESSGQKLSWYFDQVLRGTEMVDYAVTRVIAEPADGFAGYRFKDIGVGEVVAPVASKPPQYRNEVVVERLGGVRLPVELLVVFDDGTTATAGWDGQDRWKRFEYSGPQRVEWAVVDPHRKLLLDVNFVNNSRTRAVATRGVVRVIGRWSFWFQNLLQLATGM